jgi:hypothetical protein
MHRWLWWLPRDSADTGRYGRWRRWLRTARCDGGVARPLHAEDHSPPRRGRKRANAGPNRIRKRPSSAGLPLPGLCWLWFRRAIDDSAQRRPSWTGARSRTPQSWVGSLGDSKQFDPTAPCGPLRACMPVVCPSHQKIDFNNLHRSTRNPGVYRCIAPNGLLRTGATALRGRDRLVLAIFEDR